MLSRSLLRCLSRCRHRHTAPFSSLPPGICTALSAEEAAIRDSAAKFAKDVLAPNAQRMDRDMKIDPAVLKAMFTNGFMGIEIPSKFGGAEQTFLSSCIVIEEFAKADAALSGAADIQNTLINTAFRKFASQAQQERYLPRLAVDTLASFCLSEPSRFSPPALLSLPVAAHVCRSGSDAFAMKTRAHQDASSGRWIINGSKCWISGAKEAGFFLVFANAAPELKHKGITAFVVEATNPGLHVGRNEQKLGIRASSTCEVSFADCVVEPDAVLGGVGNGYKIAIGLLNEGRIGIAFQTVGLAQGAFQHAMQYMHTRVQFGQPIANFQGMQFQYAEAAIQIEAARTMMYNAARMKQAGLPVVKEAAMCKFLATTVAEATASKCINWMGGNGITEQYMAEKYYRDAKVLFPRRVRDTPAVTLGQVGQIYEGTSNIQLQTIANILQHEYKSW